MHIFEPLVKDSTASNFSGTGAVVTQGAQAIGYQAITAVGTVGDTFGYMIRKEGNAQWEEGLGTRTANGFTRSPLKGSSGTATLVNFAAGQYDVTHTLTSSLIKKFHSSTSAKRVYLSAFGIVSDADVSLGSTTLGIDQGAAIQAVFDLAVNLKCLEVVCDVAAGALPQFSDVCLKMHDNTTLMLIPGCGIIKQGSGNEALIANYDRNDGRAGIGTNGSGNKNIAIIGDGALNGAGTSFRVLQFFGVSGFVFDGPNLFNSANFHAHMGNFQNFSIKNMYIDKGTGGGIFGDGLHICGPSSDGFVENLIVRNCGDDNFALNADDAWVGNTETYQPRGAITNITAIGITMQSNLYGVRVLSGGSLVDGIYISKVRGSTNGYAVVVDCFDPAQTLVSGPGNVGTITLGDIDVDVSAGGDANLKACMSINCKIDQLNLIRYKRKFFLTSQYASVAFGARANIANLYVEAYSSSPLNGGTAVTGQFDFRSGSNVDTATFTGSSFKAASAVSGYPITVQSGATIGHLVGMGNSGTNFSDFVSNAGTIGTNHFSSTNNFMVSASTASTWVLDSGYTEGSASAVSYQGSLAPVSVARKAALDAFGGNIQVSDTITFTGTPQSALNGAILLRGTALQPYSGSTRQAYVMDINQIAGTVKMQRSVGSTDTAIGSVITASGGFTIGAAYTFTFAVNGSALRARVQRASDSFYLQTNGTWAATAVDCCTGTDTGIAAGSAQYGVYSYAYNANGTASGVSHTGFNAIAAP